LLCLVSGMAKGFITPKPKILKFHLFIKLFF
jgi:hypothetical protein